MSVFRRFIRLDETADAANEAGKLRNDATHAGLTSSAAIDLAQAFEHAVRPLIDTARLIKTQGSQMDVTRTLEGPGYQIKIALGAGQPVGLFSSLIRRLRGK